MLRLLGMIVGSVLLTSVAIAPAQAQCLLCGMVGYMLGSSGSAANATPPANGGNRSTMLMGDVLYILPHAGERLHNPLYVRQVSVGVAFGKNENGYAQQTLEQLFARAVTNPEEFEILAIQRYVGHAPTGTLSGEGSLLFTFTDKSNLRSVEELSKVLPPNG